VHDKNRPIIPRQAWPLRQARPKFTAVELCCGLGGIGIGLAAAKYKVVKAYDSWPAATAIYNHNSPEPVANTCDLVSEEGLATVRRDRRNLGDIDLLAAGPPCKGFSQIRNGHHDRFNPHNRVLLAMPQYVALFQPRLVLIENVPHLARHDGGRTLRSLIEKLERPGPRRLRYRVEYGIYDAALYGIPQARRRLLILAVRYGSGQQHLPDDSVDLTPLYASLRHGGKIPAELESYATCLADPDDLSMTSGRQALSDLPVLGASEPELVRSYADPPRNAYQRAMRAGSSDSITNTRTPAIRKETIQRLKMIPPGGCARDIPRHNLNGLSRRYDSAYRRLHPDAPSTALSTKYDCIYHFSEHRSLSVREYARLQGIPDRISFPEELACRRFAYEMIGNSVPPFLINGVLMEIGRSTRRRKTR